MSSVVSVIWNQSEVIVILYPVKQEKPKFLKKPTDQEVPEQEDAIFETEVSGKPEPEVEW